MDSIFRIFYFSLFTRSFLVEVGDVGVVVRGCYDVVVGAFGIVVIYLGIWKR